MEGWQGRIIKEGDEIFGGVMGAFMITIVGMVLRQYYGCKLITLYTLYKCSLLCVNYISLTLKKKFLSHRVSFILGGKHKGSDKRRF